MKSPSKNLLLDLALLLEKHSPQEWLRLARMIEREESRSRILAVLKGCSILADPGRTDVEREPKLATRRNKDSKLERGAEFEQELTRMSSSELRKIAIQIGLPASSKDSKKRLVKRIVRSSKLGTPALKRESSHTSAPGTAGDYSEWAKVILGKARKASTTH
jgi:hypothetical protein